MRSRAASSSRRPTPTRSAARRSATPRRSRARCRRRPVSWASRSRIDVRAVVVAIAALLLFPAAASATPWQSADRVVDRLFDAQTELVLSGPAQASKDVQQARAAYAGELREGMGSVDPVGRGGRAGAG